MSYDKFADPSQVQIVPKDYFIFNVPIYKMFNEKFAVFVMSIRPFSGELGISIAPSTMKGTNVKQSVVEKGAKIYDYTKELSSNLIYSECIKLKEYMEEGETAKWQRHTRVFNAIHKGLEELGFKNIIKKE